MMALSLFTAILLTFLPVPAKAEKSLSRTAIGRSDHAIMEPPDYLQKTGPSISSTSAIVVELNTGTVLYGKNIYQQVYPASTTKVMTALLALENLDLNASVPISYTAANMAYSGLGSNWQGRVLTAEEALHGLLIRSVNGLGHALAEKMSGSVQNFADLMNQRAAQAGALQTHYVNPHGLNDPTHVTTAFDMAKILWDAIEYDDYRRISGTYSYTCSRDGWSVTWTHTMCPLDPSNYFYDTRVICGKTGWTEEALQCRAIYASNGKRDLIICLFHSDDSVEHDVKNLLNYGFSCPAPSDMTMVSSFYRLKDGCISGIAPGTTAQVFQSRVRFPVVSSWELTDAAGVKKKTSDIMKTGDQIWLCASDGTPWYASSAVIYGDVNGDGVIDIFDFVGIRNHIIQLTGLRDAFYRSGDVNKDGTVDIFDLVGIRNHIIDFALISQ